MEKLFGMTDMALTPDEQEEKAMPTMAKDDMPKYPYGLSISLCDDEIEKLGLDEEGDNPEVGDWLRARCLLEVTSVSRNETTAGLKRRIEIQIVAMAVEEEDEENEEADDEMKEKREFSRRALRAPY